MKQPFDIDAVIERLRAATRSLPQAALFDLADRGYGSLFEQLIACLISTRTRDETSLVVALRLFERARTPTEMAQLSVAEIDQLIAAATFHEVKAPQIRAIAQAILDQHHGEVPADFAALTQFRGIGPKCANLALGIAAQQPCISVDVHVHRITNRWGYVQTKTPEKTLAALTEKLPERYWIEINQRLVPFGKHVCTGDRPHCDRCCLLEFCAQVGVAVAPA